MRAPKVNWLERRVATPGPHLCLCLSEEEYLEAMWHLKVKSPKDWILNEHSNATTHYLNHKDGSVAVVVCMRGHEGRNPVEVAGLLVHEAVHVWQVYADHIGESEPGREQEAYAVQGIAQELMAEYARRLA